MVIVLFKQIYLVNMFQFWNDSKITDFWFNITEIMTRKGVRKIWLTLISFTEYKILYKKKIKLSKHIPLIDNGRYWFGNIYQRNMCHYWNNSNTADFWFDITEIMTQKGSQKNFVNLDIFHRVQIIVQKEDQTLKTHPTY